MTTVVLQPASIDQYIDSSAPTTNFGANEQLYIGELNGVTAKTRALIKFDLSSIPDNAVFSSVTLSLFLTSDRSDNARTFAVYRMKRVWVEAQVTWNQYSSGNNWQTAGGDGANDRELTNIGTRSFSASETLNVFVDFPLGPTTKDALDLGNGWIIIANTESDDGYVFRSSNWGGTASERPKLTITYTAPNPTVNDSVDVNESVSVVLSRTASVSQAVSVTDTPLLQILNTGQMTLFQNITVSESVAFFINPYVINVNEHIALTESKSLAFSYLISKSESISVAESTARSIGSSINKSESIHVTESFRVDRGPILRRSIIYPKPLLYITDGSVESGGSQHLFDLLGITSGFLLDSWEPALATYKGDGVFNDSPLATGRRLVFRRFQNQIQTFNLKARSHDQNSLAKYTNELLQWLESAADYWESTWSILPIYLVARSAYESNTRYAVIHKGSIDKLNNPYTQPFFGNNKGAVWTDIVLTLELGHWTDQPPKEMSCVAINTNRQWTVADVVEGDQGGTITAGDILSLAQATTGRVIAGTNNAAKIYGSTDDGVTWSLLQTIGATTDSVNALAKDSAGNLYAAVSGSAGARGIWKSTNNGTTWTRVKAPSGAYASTLGYYDVTVGNFGTEYIYAVGNPLSDDAPLEYSTNAGTSWIRVSIHTTQNLIGVSFLEGYAYFIDQGYYTLRGRYSPLATPSLQYINKPGAVGNVGLDLISYIYYSGSQTRDILISVRAESDVANTEIWRWKPDTGDYNFTNWQKLTTVPSERLQVLYADPKDFLTSPNPTQRTIWGGGNGNIWVSTTTGYTWTVYSTSPTGQINSFLRTSSGVLIAGGSNGEVFLFGDTSGGGSGAVEITTYTIGQEDTCLNAAYVANKSQMASISHVKRFNATSSAYTDLQFSSNPPYQLYPTTPGLGDTLYFGIQSGITDLPNNTFSSLVFDLTTVADGLTIVWEYWNGSWATLSAEDKTNGFRTIGVSSVAWQVPTNWAVTVVDGVLGYWVRARITAVAGTPVSPIQSNRYIYSVVQSNIRINPDEIHGTIPSLSRVKWYNQADGPSFTALEVNRVLVGLRSHNRGVAFDAYLNISNLQIPDGFSLSTDTDATWTADSATPTGRKLNVSYSSGSKLNTWNSLVTFTIDNAIARDYYGTYRAFVRCKKNSGTSSDWQLRIRVSFGSGGGSADGRSSFVTTNSDWEVVDLGSVSIPTARAGQLSGNLGDSLSISVQGFAASLGVILSLYDLVLIPVDEWAVDAITPDIAVATGTGEIESGNYLDVDSISNLKSPITSTNRTNGDLVKAIYQSIGNGPAILQVDREQCLWFFAMFYNNYWRAYPDIAGSVQVFKQQRYLGLRGEE